MKKRQFTTVVKREGKVYVSHCPEFDIASQGDTVEQARSNLQEAVELFLETADPSEIKRRLHDNKRSRAIHDLLGMRLKIRPMTGEEFRRVREAGRP